MLNQIIDYFNCRDRTGKMIVKVKVQTLAAGRLLFVHKCLSHVAMNKAAVRAGLADHLEGRTLQAQLGRPATPASALRVGT